VTELLLVQLDWLDACSGDPSWTHRDEVDHGPSHVCSVGLLVKRDGTGFTLAQSHNLENDHVDATLFVPQANVTGFHVLTLSRLDVPSP
jgi:hypothetical protein